VLPGAKFTIKKQFLFLRAGASSEFLSLRQ